MNDVLAKSTKRRGGRGVNPLYILVPLSAVLLGTGIWLLVPPTNPPDTNVVPQFPAWVQASGAKGRRAYTQAVAYQEELQYIPCYCGCGNMGHKAVVDCHIDDVADDGSITYDRHSST
jgi:hypothetical protein